MTGPGGTRWVALEPGAVDAALAAADGPRWEHLGGRLVAVRSFASFPAAIAFVDEVARLAEERDHHPDIDVRYRTVTLALVTHDAGGITEADLELARAVDGLADSGRPPA
jgi:4a-hydroxytetrahydrobiopterin dehydratase